MYLFTTTVAACALAGKNIPGWMLLVIYEDESYYSDVKTYKQLIFFKKPSSIVKHPRWNSGLLTEW